MVKRQAAGGGGVGDAANGPSRKIKVLRRNGMGVGGGGGGGGGGVGGMLVKERNHNTSKYSKYLVGDSSVLEKICKNYQKLGGWVVLACLQIFSACVPQIFSSPPPPHPHCSGCQKCKNLYCLFS